MKAKEQRSYHSEQPHRTMKEILQHNVANTKLPLLLGFFAFLVEFVPLAVADDVSFPKGFCL